jgi:hypothetical protein
VDAAQDQVDAGIGLAEKVLGWWLAIREGLKPSRVAGRSSRSCKTGRANPSSIRQPMNLKLLQCNIASPPLMFDLLTQAEH